MLGVVGDRQRFVHKKHGDSVVDPVGLPQPGVVQSFFTNEQERAAILWTNQDGAQPL